MSFVGVVLDFLMILPRLAHASVSELEIPYPVSI